MSSATSPAAPLAGRKEWMALGLLVLPALLLFMMLTILFLAIPYLAADLQPSSAQTLWILDIYGFVMAGFLVLMGTVTDRIGHRTLLVTGAAIFGVASVAAALTNDPAMMIVWRAVLGFAAAMQILLETFSWRVLPETASTDTPIMFLTDMNMLVNSGGRERSESEFRAMLTDTGFAVRSVGHGAAGPLSIIEAVPATDS